MEEDGEPEPPPMAHLRTRRCSASAQGGIDPAQLSARLKAPPTIEEGKPEEAVERIVGCVEQMPLFVELSDEYKQLMIDAMEEVTVAAGEKVITQGELGDFWYVVERGALEVWKEAGGEERHVKSYAEGDSFGELALMFNQRRAASVVATEECILWAVNQEVFQAVMMTAALANKPDYE